MREAARVRYSSAAATASAAEEDNVDGWGVKRLKEYLAESDAELKELLMLQGKLEAGVGRCERQERRP